ncbi:MAG: EAL domain-containing protein [Pseudomonadales bacterium]|nr:EAL domain-containing protein [Pseudomonadales bacterium]
MTTLENNSLYIKIPDIIRALSNTWGTEFYCSIAGGVADVLQADFTYISRLTDNHRKAKTLAFFQQSKKIDDVEYLLEGSPCEKVTSGGICVYPNHVCQHFPEDHFLQEIGVQAYIGVPLYDREHKILGLLACLFKQPLKDTSYIEEILVLFSGRISAEIESTEKTQNMLALNQTIKLKNEALNQELRRSLALQIHLENMASHDALTGLSNRHQFLQDIQQLPKSKPFWIIKSGLDNLKNINQTFGHDKGDLLIVEFAKRCQRLCDMEPKIRVYRWVSDEFLFLTEANNIENIHTLRASYEMAFQFPYYIEDIEIQLSTSEGFACLNDFKHIDAAIAAADLAMEKAKQRGGGNMLVYDASMEKANARFFDIHAALRKAIRDEALCAFYQPIYDLDSQKIIGFETLMRWLEADGSVKYGPWEFIPVAENTGQIVQLGKQIIQASLQQLQQWQQQGYNYHLSINLSPIQFYDENLLPFIDKLLEQCPIETRLIKFEVTESLFVKETELVLNKLNALKQRGFQLSLDDFGTGYSSLSYIQQYPFDYIKIDKCFIDDICSQDAQQAKKCRALVQAVILLSQGLDMQVIAEGVEEKAQADTLHQLGVNLIQGYYFGKPMPPAEIEQCYHLNV